MIIIKLHVNGLEAMYRYINSVITCQARIKGYFSAHFVEKYIEKLISMISIPKANRSIKQSISEKDIWAQQTEENIGLYWRKYRYLIVN